MASRLIFSTWRGRLYHVDTAQPTVSKRAWGLRSWKENPVPPPVASE
jgi:hypothetical protein